ncbi:golgin subfamily A member 6-like protein 7 [Ostrea edulis]|uniref:golgin subfamily A member 6-like protein 7 n=1 Tax=Ostrea edulis TaxID=37623 RepID=UPI0020943B39|nr:golgin subfamily A member 6-like protein 7 [Ostrea edulis]
MTSLDDLFNQIIHSELHAQQKKKYLHDLKCRIQSTLARKDRLQKKHIELKRELILKTNLLIQEEVNLKCEENKEKILQEEKTSLEGKKQRVQKDLTDLQFRKLEMVERFCVGVRGFTWDYGLQSGGQQRRQEELRKAVEEVKQTEQDLRKEVDDINKRREMLAEMDVQRGKEQQTLHSLQKNNEELDQELRKVTDATEALISRKSELNTVPHNDPEFLSLSKELEAVNGEHLEEKCVALQQELQRLQQILWQKQLKERKRPVAPPVQVKEKRMRSEELSTNRMTVSNFNSGESTRSQQDDCV